MKGEGEKIRQLGCLQEVLNHKAVSRGIETLIIHQCV